MLIVVPPSDLACQEIIATRRVAQRRPRFGRASSALMPLGSGGTRMQASIFIARLLGPMFVVAGVALLGKPQMFRTILLEFIRSPTWLYLAGFIGLLAGMALVLTHNVWVLDWRVIITVIGWLTLLRALITIFQPQWIVATGTAILAHRGMFLGAAVTNLIVGLVLTYFGYAA
jgi:uncharacterized membrane protein